MINFAVKLIATVALEAVQMGLQASKRTYGPRLSETQVTTADYGTPLPRFLGERRLAGQIVWSKDLDIVDNTTKVKGGGKQTTQSALWTAGVALCDCRGGIGPIDKVLKIWLDETLAYDATGTGPISYASSLHIDLASTMRIYTGAEDQGADPAYVEYCDDRYGPDSAPAFRGTAMLVFDRLPCDNFGNRPPQISVLAASAASDAFPFDSRTTTRSVAATFAFQPNGSWMAYCDDSALEWWDVPTRTLIGTSPAAGTMSGLTTNTSLAGDGTAWVAGPVLPSTDVYLFSITPLGVPSAIHTDSPTAFLKVTRAIDTTDGTSVFVAYDNHVGYLQDGVHVAHSECATDWCVDDEGNAWMLSQPVGASSTFTLTNLSSSVGTVFTGTARSATSNGRLCYVASEGHFFVYTDGNYYIIPRDTMTIASSVAGPFPNLPEQDPNRSSFWIGFSEYSLVDGSLIRALDQDDWINPSNYRSGPAFDPVNVAIWARASSSQTVRVLYVDRVASDGVTLGTIISKMCDAAGLVDRDTSLLTDIVKGYSWTRGDPKSQMEPLLDIHDVDARPHDFEIEFKPRGSASAGTIAVSAFAKNGQEPRYKITEPQDTDLPKVLRINFADTEFDQEETNVLSPLPNDVVDSQRDVVIDGTTYADTPAGMQQKADRFMRRQYTSKDTLDNSLTAQQLALEAGDVWTLLLDDGIAWTAKLEKQTFASGRMDCSFRRDETAVAALNTDTGGPSMGGRDPEVIVIPGPVRGFVIDAPFREDSDQDVRPILYSGAGPYASLAFPSAAIWEESGSGTSAAYDQLFATVSGGATWGLATSALADANPNLWDRGNSLTVNLQSGSLTSVSEADIDVDPTLNLILVGSQANGWEYLNFATATLVSGSTYTLSGFKRGRRGTEWMVGAHGAGEAFVLASALDVEEMGSDDIGDSLSFKAQSLGRSLDAAPAINIAPFTGASLKPYAPARIDWTTDGTDMFGTITRRTRIGGSWTDDGVVPLSENSEAYEVDVYHGATLKRTITVTGTNAFTYTGAQISADGNSVGVAPPVNVYQMSDAVGRGFALAA